MRFLIKIISFCLILVLSSEAKSNHLMGGEINWECITTGPNKGKFVFTVVLYRICAGIPLPSSASVSNPLSNFGGSALITCMIRSKREFSRDCYDPNQSLICQKRSEVIEEWTYISAPVQLNGTPNSSGSVFSYSTCCRLNIENSNGGGIFLQSIMYPYKEPNATTFSVLGSGSSGPSCYDSSPRLAVTPSPMVCGKYLVNHDLFRTDNELDSLAHDWAPALQSSTATVVYKTGYSSTSPLPSTTQNAGNINASIDNQTGRVNFNTLSPLDTKFYVGTKCAAYRDGQKIAEVFRDAPMLIFDCDTNTSNPQVFNQNTPLIELKKDTDTSFATTFHDTFQLGEVIKLDIRATDFDSLPTNPVSKQSVLIEVRGDAMSDSANNAVSCFLGDCAFIDSIGNPAWNGKIFQDTTSVTLRFVWNTDCVNLFRSSNGDNDSMLTYNFRIYAFDNWCPIGREGVLDFHITLIDTIFENPQIDSLDASKGGAFIRWQKSNSNVFSSYDVYRRWSLNDPWARITSIANRNFNVFKDNIARTDTSSFMYKVEIDSDSGCDIHEVRTINMYLVDVVGQPQVRLFWNQPYNPGVQVRSGVYEVFRTDTTRTVWSRVGATNFGTETYVDNKPIIGHKIWYKIVSKDAEGLRAISNTDTSFFAKVVDTTSDTTFIPELALSQLDIFPNPANNFLTITVPSADFAAYLHILDISGKQILSEQIVGERSRIDVSGLKPGMYFMHIRTLQGQRIVRKLMISN